MVYNIIYHVKSSFINVPNISMIVICYRVQSFEHWLQLMFVPVSSDQLEISFQHFEWHSSMCEHKSKMCGFLFQSWWKAENLLVFWFLFSKLSQYLAKGLQRFRKPTLHSCWYVWWCFSLQFLWIRSLTVAEYSRWGLAVSVRGDIFWL